MKEIWKPILGYEEYYSVSNCGRIQRIKDSSWAKKGIFLKAHKDRCGYLQVNLYKKGSKRITIKLHKVVAMSFLGLIQGRKEINHKDGNKNNNSPSNLEYISHQENVRHAWDNKLCKPNFGRAILNEVDVLKIRSEHFSGKRYFELSLKYKVSVYTIGEIIRRETWKHI